MNIRECCSYQNQLPTHHPINSNSYSDLLTIETGSLLQAALDTPGPGLGTGAASGGTAGAGEARGEAGAGTASVLDGPPIKVSWGSVQGQLAVGHTGVSLPCQHQQGEDGQHGLL